MRLDDPSLLLDMLIAARQVEAYVNGVSKEAFASQVMLHDAITYQVQTIGEAASQVTQEFQREHAHIPWRRIVDMRHRLVHGYRHIDLDLVWDAATIDIPELIAQLDPLVPPEEPE